jgi:Uma2 family endonuclease
MNAEDFTIVSGIADNQGMATMLGLTIEDFERLPDALARNHELVDGELVDVPGNTWEHISVKDNLLLLLGQHVKQQGLGRVVAEQEFDFDGNAHGPDISFLTPMKVGRANRRRRVQEFVPDMAIEVVSANDKANNLFLKAKRYRKAGTKEVWVMVIETRQAFRFSDAGNAVLEEDDEFRSDLIPGFSARLGELFDVV